MAPLRSGTTICVARDTRALADPLGVTLRERKGMRHAHTQVYDSAEDDGRTIHPRKYVSQNW